MFPTSISGKYKVAIISQEEADIILEKLQATLYEAQAADLYRRNNTLHFQGGMLRFSAQASWNIRPHWRILDPVDNCWIDVAFDVPNGVRYEFSTVQLLIIITTVTILFSIGIISNLELSFLSALAVLIVGWTFLFGMSYTYASVSLRNFIRNTLR